MKKILSLIVLMVVAATAAISQAPGIFNYQGVARNSVGNVLINQSIRLRLTIHDGAPGGPVVYQESRIVTTNPFGLFNAQVGSAGSTNVTGTIAGVPWGVGTKYIQVEIDPAGGTSFINIGTAQIASVPYSLFATLAGDLVLPFIKTQSAPATTLIGITNSATTGTLGALNGTSASTDANASAVIGTMSSTTPGGFSAGVRGINNGTAGLGIGVYGSQNGSGWGVYGTTPGGIGVHGNSTSGFGVYGLSTSGVGVYGLSNTSNAGRFENTNAANTADALVATTNGAASSWALRATSTGLQGAGIFTLNNATTNATVVRATSNGLGRTGFFDNTNAANNSNTLDAVTNGGGNAVFGNRTATTGTVAAVQGTSASTDANAMGVQGTIGSTSPGGFSAGVRGTNNGTGGLGIGVYGSQSGSGWGVYGTTPNGIGVHGNSTNGFGMYGLSTAGIGVYGLSTNGESGRFEITNNANANNALTGVTNGAGNGVFGQHSAATGTNAGVRGESNSQDANANAIVGVITSTSPGGFSSALRGINNGTGGLGIGVYGSQAGSGWGVYGTTPNGLGVYGNATGAGFGVYGNSTTGTGIYGISNAGNSARFEITNAANTNHVVEITGNNSGRGLNVITSGPAGNSVRALLGTAPSTSIATSGSIYGESNTGIGVIGVSGSQNGVYGLSTGSLGGTVGVNTGTGNGLWGVNSGTGRAGFFEISNPGSTSSTVNITTNGLGSGLVVQLPNAANGARGVDVLQAGVGPGVFATSAGGTAVWGITSSISAAGVIGDNTYGEAVVGRNRGGVGVGAVVGRNDSSGYGVRGFVAGNPLPGTGIGVLGQSGISGNTGTAGRFENVNAVNTSTTVQIATNGIGGGLQVSLPNAASGARGIDVLHAGVGPAGFAVSSGGMGWWGITASISAAGILGDNTFGEAVVGRNRGGIGVGAVVGRNDSSGYGVRGFNTRDGIGVLGQAGISGGTGQAGRFENVNAANPTTVVTIASNGTGTGLLVNNANGGATNLAIFAKSGGNVARIADNGQIFANGGFTVGGADVAELFAAEGLRSSYEPGDVLVISQTSDRKVEKSSLPYSTLVSGVYATKPGMQLTEENAVDGDLSGLVPMGVIGVIPTKVCLEGGAIKRGDLLVTSSIPGVAMKADPDKVKVGQVLGKALQDYNANEVGKINVLVSVK